jgi:hypothetical protein
MMTRIILHWQFSVFMGSLFPGTKNQLRAMTVRNRVPMPDDAGVPHCTAAVLVQNSARLEHDPSIYLDAENFLCDQGRSDDSGEMYKTV